MYSKFARRPTIQVAISLEPGGPEVHPRMADMCCKIENEIAYLEEHGSGGTHSDRALDFLERVWKALTKCPEGHPVRAKFGKQIEDTLSKFRPSAAKEQE